MCRMLVAEGVRLAAALAHQNADLAGRHADRMRAARRRAGRPAAQERLEFPRGLPDGEVMVGPDTVADWQAGKLPSVGDHGKYLLVEMPHGLYLDVRPWSRRSCGRAGCG